MQENAPKRIHAHVCACLQLEHGARDGIFVNFFVSSYNVKLKAGVKSEYSSKCEYFIVHTNDIRLSAQFLKSEAVYIFIRQKT